MAPMDSLQSIKDYLQTLYRKIPDAVHVEQYIFDVEYLLSLVESQQRTIDAAIRDLGEFAPFASTCKLWEQTKCGHKCLSARCPGWEWRGANG